MFDTRVCYLVPEDFSIRVRKVVLSYNFLRKSTVCTNPLTLLYEIFIIPDSLYTKKINDIRIIFTTVPFLFL